MSDEGGAASGPAGEPPGDGVAIAVRGLTKSYRGVPALRGIDLEIRRGEIFALLGPNGAGKTTTVEILEGYRRRDGGTVSVLGLDPERDRARLTGRLGIVLQSVGVDRFLTVAETIAMYGSYYPRPRPVDEVVALVGLQEKRDSRVARLSGGQQRRVDVAVALVGDPELVFLDEPTTGFDPSARREAWDVVKGLAALGKTIVLTTHYLDEAQQLADRVAVVAGGRIVAEGTPDTLGGRDLVRPRIRVRLPAGAEPPADLAGAVVTPAAGPGAADGRVTEFVPDDLTRALHTLTGWALDGGFTLAGLEVLRPSLEEVYLELTAAHATGSAGAADPAGAEGAEGAAEEVAR